MIPLAELTRGTGVGKLASTTYLWIFNYMKKILSVNKLNPQSRVFDIEVEETHNYFADGILVHNCDGGRAEAVVSVDGAVSMHSRNGNELLVHGVFDFLSKFAGFVVDGEIVSIDRKTGIVRDRKTSNGLYTKCVRNTISQEEADTLHYVVWDVIPIEDFFLGVFKIPYSSRFKQLQIGFSNLDQVKSDKRISIVQSKSINTVAQATEFYDEMVAQGLEGAMLKLSDAGWESRRSRSVLKLKEELDATLECYGAKPHSKNPDWIGSLELRSSCGLIDVSVGSGLTEEDRKKDPSEFIGKLIAIKYNALIQARGRDTHSMFLPIFQQIRDDVKEADTLKILK